MSFNLNSGAASWNYLTPSQTSTSSISASTSDGNLLIIDSQQGLIQLDPSGNAGAAVPGIQAATPYNLGAWSGLASGGVNGLIVGPTVDLALVWPTQKGGEPPNDTAAKPKFTHFLPVDPGVDYHYWQLPKDMESRGYVPPTVADHVFKTGSDATVDAFLKTLAKPTDAVAFIGHAAYARRANGTFYSVGLCFWGGDCLQRTPVHTPPGTDLDYTPLGNPVLKSVIPNQAKVIFIASCYVGKVFTDFWGRDYTSPNTSKGRAIIVPASINPLINPNSGPLDLIPGKDAWLLIATLLSEGHTVTEAVAAANALMLTKHYTGVSWTALGDPDNARIAPQRKP